MLTKPNSYQLVLENGQLILKLLPGLTEAPWSEIEQAGFEAVSEVQKLTKPQVVIDLTELNYIGSSQVALVIRIWKAVKVQDGALVVATANSTVREVLSLSGLDRVWKMVNTSDEAKSALGRRDVQPVFNEDGNDASPFPAYALLAACVVGILGLIAFGMDAISVGRVLLATGGVLALGAGTWGLLTTFGTLRLFAGSGVTAGVVLVLISFLLPQPKAGFRRSENESESAVTAKQSASSGKQKPPAPKVEPPSNDPPKAPVPAVQPTPAAEVTNQQQSNVKAEGDAASKSPSPGVTDPVTEKSSAGKPSAPEGAITPRSSMKDL